MSLLSRDLGFEDWKKEDKKNVDKRKFNKYWKQLSSTKQVVCWPLLRALSYLTLWAISIRNTKSRRRHSYVFVAFVTHCDVYLMSHLLQAEASE